MERIDAQRALKRELEQARAELLPAQARSGTGGAGAIIGRSPPMLRLLDRIETIAQSDAPVLITGESGTGKELVARTLHERSARRAKPFVAVNCAAFPETLLEAELFGHERGAFTGAVKRRDGRFKAADGGTLLLDEIAEMPLPAQAKLLRVLQEGTVEPLGTNEVDARRRAHHLGDPPQPAGADRGGTLPRGPLLPAQRPRHRDPAAARAARRHAAAARSTSCSKFARRASRRRRIAPRAWAVLSQYHFPGNVREFAHAIEHAVVLAGGGEIDVEHLPGRDHRHAATAAAPRPRGQLRSLSAALKEFEHEYLMRALAQANGKKMKAAEILGISRKNLWEKLRLHGIAAETEPSGETRPRAST